MIGKVTRWQATYGKIWGADKVSYLCHRDDLVDVCSLAPGQRVEFKPVDTDKGPKAEDVRRVEAW
jgi:cold shock CspA family protein